MPKDTAAIAYADIMAAAEILDPVVNRTPVLTSRDADRHVDAKLFFKCENFQKTGAFKFRGAFSAISSLSSAQRRSGVITYSSGNHAHGIALAAHLLDVRATVVMPSDAPVTKLHAVRKHGANVVLYDPMRDDREAMAAELARKLGGVLIPSSESREVVAGQGTAVKELIETVGELDFLFVPVGGGGLLAGSAVAAAQLSPGCAIYGVEPEAGNDGQQSMRTGAVVHIATPVTIADGARNQHIAKLVLPIAQKHVKGVVTVTDEELRVQMRFFAENMKMVVEPTGCLAAAAVFNRAIDLSGARVGVIVSGGNVETDFLGSMLLDARTA
jgi:threonine dehydratase